MLFQFTCSACFLVLLLSSCSKEKETDIHNLDALKQKIQELTDLKSQAEKNDDLKRLLSFYQPDAICMPEYQLTLDGTIDLETYFKEILQRQKIKTFQRTVMEIIPLGNTIIEIGIFNKTYTLSTDSLITQTGKYWHIWNKQSDGNFKLKGEALGFFQPVSNPELLVVKMNTTQPDDSIIYSQKEIPFELKAYNALMEKGVRSRDGLLRSSFFTDDASIYPFADTTVTGMDQIKPYLIAYSNRGVVTIDSIMCYTYDFEYLDDYIIEYDMFKVKWNVPGYSGRTEGKGIRLWKRQEDKSLKLYREIGTHNHLN